MAPYHCIISCHCIIPLHRTIASYHCIVPLHHTIASYHVIPLASYHYIIPLHHTIASHHCIIPLHHAIASYHCLISLPYTIALVPRSRYIICYTEYTPAYLDSTIYQTLQLTTQIQKRNRNLSVCRVVNSNSRTLLPSLARDAGHDQEAICKTNARRWPDRAKNARRWPDRAKYECPGCA